MRKLGDILSVVLVIACLFIPNVASAFTLIGIEEICVEVEKTEADFIVGPEDNPTYWGLHAGMISERFNHYSPTILFIVDYENRNILLVDYSNEQWKYMDLKNYIDATQSVKETFELDTSVLTMPCALFKKIRTDSQYGFSYGNGPLNFTDRFDDGHLIYSGSVKGSCEGFGSFNIWKF